MISRLSMILRYLQGIVDGGVLGTGEQPREMGAEAYVHSAAATAAAAAAARPAHVHPAPLTPRSPGAETGSTVR